jgi:hypothetical protein
MPEKTRKIQLRKLPVLLVLGLAASCGFGQPNDVQAAAVPSSAPVASAPRQMTTQQRRAALREAVMAEHGHSMEPSKVVPRATRRLSAEELMLLRQQLREQRKEP